MRILFDTAAVTILGLTEGAQLVFHPGPIRIMALVQQLKCNTKAGDLLYGACIR
jgi:hypothetical protein